MFFMVLALHTLLKARRNPIEQKNDSTLKASTELGRLVIDCKSLKIVSDNPLY